MLARNPHSLTTFEAWLNLQPANQSYNWSNLRDCAFGQFHKTITGKEPDAEAYIEWLFSHRYHSWIVRTEPHTFGAAHKRARAALEHSYS